jgi:CheY-like chemotaxis protein
LLLKKQADLALPEKVIKHMQHIAFSGKKLGELINSVLDLAKIEAGKMELHTTPVNLPELIHNIAGMLKGGADEKGVIFKLHMAPDLPKWISSDETKLGQILINILSNAIKFTPKGKQVSLQVRSDKQHLIFTVQDEGIGISTENLSRLFIPFEQADNSISRQFGGTGLGLAISKQLTALLQGKLEVHSQLGKGSTFTLHLPLVQSAAPQQPEITQHVLKGTVLVVEDNNINQEVISAMLEDTQLRIIFADDGEQGLTLFNNTGVDLILMDLHLPGIDGYETARRVRALNTQVPIIALSADVLNETTAQQQQLFVSYLTKPVNQELLLKALYTHLPA